MESDINNRMKYEFHEAANLFPMDESTIDDLASDIKANGQLVKIELYDNKIIDGRRRFKACEIASVEPQFINVDVSDPIAHVMSLNLHRRHLNASQLSIVGARAREIYDRQAKERMSEGGKRHVEGKVTLPSLAGQSRDLAGKAVGVSGSYIDRATKVVKNAQPEVVKAVEDGRMSVTKAAAISCDPPEVQKAEAEKPRIDRIKKPLRGDEEDGSEIKIKGVGVIRANEAINSLSRIPKNDQLRKRGFQIVTDWIRANK